MSAIDTLQMCNAFASPLFATNSSSLAMLSHIQKSYSKIHGYLAAFMCSVGIITNIINVIVFSRPKMSNSVTFVLMSIAICDLGTMLPYLIYAIVFNIYQNQIFTYTLPWMVFLEIHMVLTTISHSSNLWLSVAVSWIRYKVLRDEQAAQPIWLDVQRARIMTVVICALTTVAAVPVLSITYPMKDVPKNGTNSSETWYMGVPPFCVMFHCFWLRFALITQAIFLKLAPCLLLSYCVVSLLSSLRAFEKKAKELRSKSNRRGDKTAVTLLCLVTVSLITELPQSVISILYGLYPYDALHFYYNLGDLLDFCSLFNSFINFVFYWMMNSTYRRTVISLLCPSIISKLIFGHTTFMEAITRRSSLNMQEVNLNVRRSSKSTKKSQSQFV